MSLINRPQKRCLTSKVIRFGADHLSNMELLYLIFSQFCSDAVAYQKASQFINEYHDLTRIVNLSKDDWMRYFKNEEKVSKMVVILEFMQRGHQLPSLTLGQIGSSVIIGKYLIEKFKFERQETLYGIFLDAKNQIIYEKGIFKGTLDSATVHPREIFRIAVQYAAARIIIAHNHPSGSIEPSKNDQMLTNQMTKCGEIMGIELLDHLIIGNSGYFSFRDSDCI